MGGQGKTTGEVMEMKLILRHDVMKNRTTTIADGEIYISSIYKDNPKFISNNTFYILQSNHNFVTE